MTLSRRAFLAASAAALVTPAISRADTGPVALRMVNREIRIFGKSVKAQAIEGAADAVFLNGADFNVTVENALRGPALLHWHGLTPPAGSDGAMPEPAIKPKESLAYRFPLLRTGTHLMRAGSGLWQQTLLAAPLIVRDLNELVLDQLETVVMFQDFTFRDPDDVLTEIKNGKAPRTLLGMGSREHSVVDRETGIFRPDALLANERTLDDPQLIAAEPGQTVRLRLINACAASQLLLDFGALDALLTALDGNAISVLRVRELALAPGQRADLRVTIPAAGAYPLLARAEGLALRAGVILASQGAVISKLEIEGPVTPLLNEFALEARPFGAEGLADRPADIRATFDMGGEPGPGWNINGVNDANGEILQVKPGSRVEVLIRNQSRYTQSLHFHGHRFQILGGDDQRFAGAMRDTIMVPAQARILIGFDADNPGRWPFASTNIYRRAAGLQGLVTYAGA